jgi:flagellar biosynthesis activator protein FlaF
MTMQNAAEAYGQVAKQTASPRNLEANLLLQAASRLQAVRDADGGRGADLNGALLFNRRLWSMFLTTVTNPENPLPAAIRQNVANLGLFVMNQTLNLTADPKPERLRLLIDINREVAAGLMGRAA